MLYITLWFVCGFFVDVQSDGSYDRYARHHVGSMDTIVTPTQSSMVSCSDPSQPNNSPTEAAIA